ncbi:MAG: hypothetical protein CEN88_396, partial [Candidatus Berkelbacteria bacterium Licking1014_2]
DRGIAIHGGRDENDTKKKLSPTAACIRMFNKDIARVYDLIKDNETTIEVLP